MYSLCCISNALKPRASFQLMTWSRFKHLEKMYGLDYAIATLSDRWYNNISVTMKTILYCIDNNWNYRLSSSIFPLITHPDFNIPIKQTPRYSDIMSVFDNIRGIVTSGQIRLSAHPDHYNVLATRNKTIIAKTVRELNHHGWFMDMMGCYDDYRSPINIHINNSRDTHQAILDMVIDNMSRLHDSVVRRLVFENEDRGIWNVSALYDNIYSSTGIPITYDNLHDACNSSDSRAASLCALTWNGIKPLFHYSESDPNSTNIRAHATYATGIPTDDQYDWEIELKGKDDALLLMRQF